MSRVLVAAAVVLALAGPAAAGPEDERAVLATLDRMVAATRAKDAAALAAVYHDDLLFCHTAGLVQSKAEVIKSVVDTKRQLESMTFDPRSVTVVGTTALVKNATHMRYVGETRQIDLDTLWVLVRESDGWRILSRHANRPPEPAK